MSLRAKRSNLIKKVEIATLPLVARNDNLLYEIAHPVPSKTKESSTLLAVRLYRNKVPDLEMGNKYIVLTIKEYLRCHFASI